MRIIQRTFRPAFCFLLLLLTLTPAIPAGGADNPVIRDIVVGNSSRDLLLYFQVDKAFRPEMEEGVMNGIPATFTISVSLREVVDGRPGRQLADLTFQHVLSYDVLKEEFRLSFSEHDSVLTCRDLVRAKQLMSEVNDARIISLADLAPNREYFLSAKVRLERKTLPLFFHYLIPFWQLGDYETDWHYVQFKY